MAAAKTESDGIHRPFSDKIMSVWLPEQFKHPIIEKYDGLADAQEHLAMFNAHMDLYCNCYLDAVRCKVFPTTLTNFALRWFSNLPPKSINNFAELSAKFLDRHALTIAVPKTYSALREFKQGRNESLREYINRFNQLAMQIAVLDPKIAIRTIRSGLKPGPFASSLLEQPPQNLDELRKRSSGYINVEEEQEHKAGIDAQGNDHDDPMIITVKTMDSTVHSVLIDQGSWANILYHHAFVMLGLKDSMLKPFAGALNGEEIKGEALGCIDLKTTFGEGEHAKTTNVRYLVVDSVTTYNIIIGRHGLNDLGAIVSTSQLTMKYPLPNGKVGVVRADQKTTT